MKNVTLRRLTIKDIYKLQAVVSKNIAEAASLAWPFDRKVATVFIEDYDTWGIWLNGDILIGAIEIRDTGEMAYLVKEQWQNKGYATYAVTEAKERFFDKQLWCYVNPNNVASLRVAQKAQMRIQYYNE